MKLLSVLSIVVTSTASASEWIYRSMTFGRGDRENVESGPVFEASYSIFRSDMLKPHPDGTLRRVDVEISELVLERTNASRSWPAARVRNVWGPELIC